MFMRVAIPVQEEGYNPSKEELVAIVPQMPIFYGKKRGNHQGMNKN